MNKISLGITFGENGSDITYGWNGGMAGYSLYHYHFTNIIEGIKIEVEIVCGKFLKDWIIKFGFGPRFVTKFYIFDEFFHFGA